jgi:hypothetical protein
MAEATKSVLLVDYDSIHRSLSEGDSAAVGRFSSRLSAWIGAIEAGSLFATRPEAPSRRRVLIRRCYADPAVLANERAAFLANGFQVIDCPPAEGREHNTAGIQMVLDSIDALDHPTGYEEFILLSADSDLSPLLIRLRAHNRMTAIYARLETADSYRAIADAVIEEPRFIAALLAESEPAADDEEEEEESRPPASRSEIEALARKISSATNVPLFAPRTFAELFRHLVDEIAENGYHFQTTAENVATRMADAGRNVTRRQVVFVVKGLALKGHVFSTGDTPERLADVFREQVLYLAESAGLPLDDDERRVMSSWIVGQTQLAPTGAARDTEIRKSGSPSSSDDEEAAKAGNGQSGRSSRRKPPPKPAASAKATDNAKSAEPPKATTTATKSSEPPKAPAPQRQEASAPKQAAAVPQRQEAPASKPAAPAPAAAQSMTGSTASESAATASSAREKPPTSSGAAGATGASSSRPTAPATRPASSPPKSDGDDDNKDAVESSILAAIAQAVDVLVEDSGGKSRASAEPDEIAPEPEPAEEAAAETDTEAEEVPEGDDIGDEIQRIIASYSRNRNKDNK